MTDGPNRVQPEGIYHPGVNSLTVHQIENESRGGAPLRNADIWVGDKLWRLYVPVQDNKMGTNSMHLIAALQAMGLANTVPISLEYHEENLQFLRHCVDPMATTAEPYLEVVVGGCSASVLHLRGEEIIRELADLSKQIHH